MLRARMQAAEAEDAISDEDDEEEDEDEGQEGNGGNDNNEQLGNGPAFTLPTSLCVAGRIGEARAEFPTNSHTFRGTAFDNAHRHFFVEGKKYRVPGFVATSFDETTALGFAVRNGLDLGQPAVLWVVHVDPAGEHDPTRRCKHVNFVHNGLAGRENEYLFTAYSVFTVRRVEWSDDPKTLSRIELEAALDNRVEDEGLPLAPWY
jgi:hypothetical protein